MAIKILLIDNNRLFREGIRFILENQHDFAVVGEADVGKDAVKLVQQTEPDLVLIDPDFSALNLLSQFRNCSRNSRVLALTMHSDQNYVTAALRAGVDGFVRKDCDSRDLIGGLREVMAGHGYISPSMTGLILGAYSDQQAFRANESELNLKEIEVLKLLSDGLQIDEISKKLGRSSKTVVRHRQKIMKKLKLGSIAALTRYAIKKGISSL